METAAFADPVLWKLWSLCLMSANHKKKYVSVDGLSEPILVKPGQFITGRFELHKAFYPKRSKKNKSAITLWRKLQTLEKMLNLNIKSYTKYSIITICNWNQYQFDEQQLNNNCTTTEQQLNTNKNDKNGKNDKKTTLLEPEVPTPICPHEKIRLLYNKILPELPTCTVRNKTFDQHTRARWNEDKKRQNLEWWENLFNDIRNSDFLMGRSKTNFRASLDWIVLPTNMTKILNGNYENRKEGSSWKV